MKKILSISCAVLILLSSVMTVHAAADSYNEAEKILQELCESTENSGRYIPIKDPEIRDYYPTYVAYWEYDSFSSFAVLSDTGADALKKYQVGVTTLSSFKETILSAEFSTAVELPPIILPDGCQAADDDIFLIEKSEQPDELLRELLQNPQITVLGAVIEHWAERGHLPGHSFVLKMHEGFEVKEGDIIEGDNYKLEVDAIGTDHVSCKTITHFPGYPETDSDADHIAYIKAFSEVLEARDDIDTAWVAGEHLGVIDYGELKKIKVTPLLPLKGDVDGDGKVTAYDATLALTAFSEKTAGYVDGERTLTPAQEQIADVDGDGELTAFDASMILTYFNMKYNGGYDDLTWADVLPEV